MSSRNNKSTNNKSKSSSPAKSRGRPARAAATKAKSNKNDATSEEEDEEEPEVDDKDEESEDEPLSKKAKTAEPTVNEFKFCVGVRFAKSLTFLGRRNQKLRQRNFGRSKFGRDHDENCLQTSICKVSFIRSIS